MNGMCWVDGRCLDLEIAPESSRLESPRDAYTRASGRYLIALSSKSERACRKASSTGQASSFIQVPYDEIFLRERGTGQAAGFFRTRLM